MCRSRSNHLNGAGRSIRSAFSEIEQLRSLPIPPHTLAQLVGGPAIEVVARTGENDAVILARLRLAHQPAGDVVARARRIALERIAPATAAGGAENDAVAVADPHIVDLGRQRFAAAVLAHQPFLRARRRTTAGNAPRLRVMAVIVDRDVAFLQKEKDLLDAIAAAVLAGAAAVDDRRVAFNQHRIIGLQVFAGDVLKQRPPRMTVQAVADRTTWNATVENFH